jgi:hypothetical protein
LEARGQFRKQDKWFIASAIPGSNERDQRNSTLTVTGGSDERARHGLLRVWSCVIPALRADYSVAAKLVG